MIKIIESFKEFIDTASISQGSSAWTIYSANPKSDRIDDINNFILNYLDWLEERLDELVELEEISEVDKYDTLLNTRFELDGVSQDELIQFLIKRYGKEYTLDLIERFN